MKKSLIFIISILLTLLICGFSPQNVAISTLAVTIISWIRVLENIIEGSLCVINNPQLHNPELIAQALGNFIEEIKSSNKEMQLLISNPGINPLTIHRTPENEMKINDSHRTLRIKNGDLWIADHALPLILKTGQYRQLNFSPVSDGRVHVSTGMRRKNYEKYSLILITVATILFFFKFNCAAVFLIASIIHSVLFRCFRGD